VTPRIIATFDNSDDALLFAKMKGADYTVCDGERSNWWGVRPKSRIECGMGKSDEPSWSYADQEGDHDE